MSCSQFSTAVCVKTSCDMIAAIIITPVFEQYQFGCTGNSQIAALWLYL